MENHVLFSLSESIVSKDFCIASYYVSLPPEVILTKRQKT